MTNKPSQLHQQQVRHHLLGHLNLSSEYTVLQFTAEARRCVRNKGFHLTDA